MSGRARGLAGLFDAALGKLREEVGAYPDDAAPWRTAPGITNSAGTLALHVTGNLQHFIGACLGGTGYERDRDAEFGDRDVTRAELLARIEQTRSVVAAAFAGLGESVLQDPFPGKVPPTLGERPSADEVLTYMYGHFMYHLGQVNYHRRLLASSG